MATYLNTGKKPEIDTPNYKNDCFWGVKLLGGEGYNSQFSFHFIFFQGILNFLSPSSFIEI